MKKLVFIFERGVKLEESKISQTILNFMLDKGFYCDDKFFGKTKIEEIYKSRNKNSSEEVIVTLTFEEKLMLTLDLEKYPEEIGSELENLFIKKRVPFETMAWEN